MGCEELGRGDSVTADSSFTQTSHTQCHSVHLTTSCFNSYNIKYFDEIMQNKEHLVPRPAARQIFCIAIKHWCVANKPKLSGTKIWEHRKTKENKFDWTPIRSTSAVMSWSEVSWVRSVLTPSVGPLTCHRIICQIQIISQFRLCSRVQQWLVTKWIRLIQQHSKSMRRIAYLRILATYTHLLVITTRY